MTTRQSGDKSIESDRVRQRNAGRRRPTLAVVVVSIFILAQAFLYLLLGIFLLLSRDLSVGVISVEDLGGMLTAAATTLVVGVSLTFFGLVAVAVFIGFLLRQRWAWVAAITWVAISLGIGLSAYFRGQPSYASMILDVVIVIALNHAAIHEEFREGSPAGS